jgi:hypothetical protein
VHRQLDAHSGIRPGTGSDWELLISNSGVTHAIAAACSLIDTSRPASGGVNVSLLSYGWERPCLRCGQLNLAYHQVSSSIEVEATTNELLRLLAPLCRDKGRMLGVLNVDGSWVATLSGGATVPEEFHDTVGGFNPRIMTFAHDRYEVPARSLGGHGIAEVLAGRGLVAAMPASWPGCFCAAPKLISYWTQATGRPYTAPTRVHMVEAWCGNASTRRQHGERAASCMTCREVMSTMMCRTPN